MALARRRRLWLSNGFGQPNNTSEECVWQSATYERWHDENAFKNTMGLPAKDDGVGE